MKWIICTIILSTAIVLAAWFLRPQRDHYQLKIRNGDAAVFDSDTGQITVFIPGTGWVTINNSPASKDIPPWEYYQKHKPTP